MSIDPPIRIVVADDHPVVRGGLVAMLRTISGLDVVGEASDGEAAVLAVLEHRPDVILMDVRMPGKDGIEATRQIREQAPDCRVLILTMYDDDATVFTAMQAGAQGYLLKEAEQDDIVRAVHGVVAGEAIFGPGVATDVRALVVKTVVFGVVALTYISTFMALIAFLELAGNDDPSPGILAFLGVLLAAGVHPLRVVLRGLIDELIFGDRPDPLRAATLVADQIGDDPLLALRAIREALMLPYASISAEGVELAKSGTSVTDTRQFPLSLGSDEMGEIVVGLRPGDRTLSTGDEHLLRIVAPLLAQTLRARRLTNDLKESRAAAITSIEEERRRLRRDLHDGLGPTFSGIAFTADAARNTIASDPATADALLLRLRADAVAAVSEIRRLVYDMRPPALDELGLVPALRQQVASMQTAQGHPMHVRVEAHDLPALPAAVEVAAFRIATEAAINSARHSGTDQAWVQIQHQNGCLEVSVRDTGSTVGSWVPGVGLSSMRERAAEVGGVIEMTTNREGSLIRALLPLA